MTGLEVYALQFEFLFVKLLDIPNYHKKFNCSTNIFKCKRVMSL